jgi:hypothetical protein
VLTRDELAEVEARGAEINELRKTLARLERNLQGKKHEITRTDPGMAEAVSALQKIDRELRRKLAALPGRAELDLARTRDRKEADELHVRLQRLVNEVEKQRATEDAGSGAGQWPELAQGRERLRELRVALLNHEKDLRKLEMDSRRNDPDIAALYADKVRLRKDLQKKLEAHPEVAGLRAEYEAARERQIELLRTNSAMVASAKRAAMAAPGFGDSGLDRSTNEADSKQ